jgi:hypothetical protein
LIREISKALDGSLSVPSKDKNSEVQKVIDMGSAPSKISYKEALLDNRDLELLSNREERVQGLSGASFDISESEEDQGSDSISNLSKDK